MRVIQDLENLATFFKDFITIEEIDSNEFTNIHDIIFSTEIQELENLTYSFNCILFDENINYSFSHNIQEICITKLFNLNEDIDDLLYEHYCRQRLDHYRYLFNNECRQVVKKRVKKYVDKFNYIWEEYEKV